MSIPSPSHPRPPSRKVHAGRRRKRGRVKGKAKVMIDHVVREVQKGEDVSFHDHHIMIFPLKQNGQRGTGTSPLDWINQEMRALPICQGPKTRRNMSYVGDKDGSFCWGWSTPSPTIDDHGSMGLFFFLAGLVTGVRQSQVGRGGEGQKKTRPLGCGTKDGARPAAKPAPVLAFLQRFVTRHADWSTVDWGVSRQ